MVDHGVNSYYRIYTIWVLPFDSGATMIIPFHVYPLNDIVEHETKGENCVCGPEIETDELGRTTLIIHHSLDGREKHE